MSENKLHKKIELKNVTRFEYLGTSIWIKSVLSETWQEE